MIQISLNLSIFIVKIMTRLFSVIGAFFLTLSLSLAQVATSATIHSTSVETFSASGQSLGIFNRAAVSVHIQTDNSVDIMIGSKSVFSGPMTAISIAGGSTLAWKSNFFRTQFYAANGGSSGALTAATLPPGASERLAQDTSNARISRTISLLSAIRAFTVGQLGRENSLVSLLQTLQSQTTRPVFDDAGEDFFQDLSGTEFFKGKDWLWFEIDNVGSFEAKLTNAITGNRIPVMPGRKIRLEATFQGDISVMNQIDDFEIDAALTRIVIVGKKRIQ